MSAVLIRRAVGAAVLFGLVVSAALGQGLRESESDFDRAAKATSKLRADLFAGKEQADTKNKDHVAAIDHAARGIVYRLHWVSQGRTHAPNALQGWVLELDTKLSKMSR